MATRRFCRRPCRESGLTLSRPQAQAGRTTATANLNLWFSGATILGDGGVSLILDVAALIRSSRQLADEQIFS